MKKDISVVILSGGKNSRMNYKTKAFLNLGEKRFIDLILEKLEGFKDIYISCNDFKLYSEFTNRCTLISDDFKDIGPISGIYSALKNIDTNKLLVIAADMPFVEKKFIDSMCSIDFNSELLVANVGNNIEPLFAIYKKSAIKTIESFIANKDYKLKNIINSCKSSYFYIDNSTCVKNINTVDEYLDVQKMYKKPIVINIVASCSNSGKTTLIEGIIKELKKSNCIVSTIKHDVHGFDIDKKGKDTYKHRLAGADNVSISSKNRFALIKELKEEISLNEIINQNLNSDYIIIEGYKHSNLRKIEVFRKGFSKDIITPKENLIAIATDDFSLDIDSDIPRISLNDYKSLVKLINEEE
ncbi:MAG: molybdopterin-guanine dinucleotide biosynthesis protein B [Sarcina sp.]